MGRRLIRSINGQSGPVDNLSSPTSESLRGPRWTQTRHFAVDASQKRARVSEPSIIEGETSRFFGARVPTIARRESQYLDRGRVAKSASGVGRPPSAVAGVEELRGPQSRTDVKSNRRIRHSRRTTRSLRDTSSLDSHQDRHPTSRTSPDVLSNHDEQSLLVVSDLVRPRGIKKRVHSEPETLEEPKFKRNKKPMPQETIDDSEDELHHGGMQLSQSQTSAKSATNSPRKGDIKPTVFATPEKRSRTSPSVSFRVLRACSGSDYYNAKNQNLKISLSHSQHDELIPVSEAEVSQEKLQSMRGWLSIQLAKVTQVYQAASLSGLVILKRRVLGNASSQLVLDLGQSGNSQSFLSLFPQRIQGVDRETKAETLVKMVNRAFAEAESYNQKPKSRPNGTLDTYGRKSAAHHRPVPEQSYTESCFKKRVRSVSPVETPVRIEGKLPDAPGEASRRSSRTSQRRATRYSSPIGLTLESPLPERWSEQNREWEQEWQKSLIYPSRGKNRTTVDKEDVPRLDEGEFLNDNLVNFYLRFLQIKLQELTPDVMAKIYIFSTFFYTTLRSGRGKIQYDAVKTWTAKVDIFSYDYIVVPVNENFHWYLAIICNAPRALEGLPQGDDVAEVVSSSSQTQALPRETSPPVVSVERSMSEVTLDDSQNPKLNGLEQETRSTKTPVASSGEKTPTPEKVSSLEHSEPKIITLDSLSGSHPATVRVLREYLVAEAQDKKKRDLALPPKGMTGKGIPLQENYCDCGAFILAYMEHFLTDPETAAQQLLGRQELDWQIDPSEVRTFIRNVLLDLQAKQRQDHEKEAEAKREAKKLRMSQVSQSSPAQAVSAKSDLDKPPSSAPLPSASESVEVIEEQGELDRSGGRPQASGQAMTALSPTSAPGAHVRTHQRKSRLPGRWHLDSHDSEAIAESANVVKDNMHSSTDESAPHHSTTGSPMPGFCNGDLGHGRQGGSPVQRPESTFVRPLSESDSASEADTNGRTTKRRRASLEFVSERKATASTKTVPKRRSLGVTDADERGSASATHAIYTSPRRQSRRRRSRDDDSI